MTHGVLGTWRLCTKGGDRQGRLRVCMRVAPGHTWLSHQGNRWAVGTPAGWRGRPKGFHVDHHYCPGWNGLSEANIQTGISALQSAGADLCIFAPHWGKEGSYQVSPNQEAFARMAIDAGAQIVCGTHPHVLQRVEEYNGGYIFYSLGNWSFGGNTSPRDRDTAIAQIKLLLQKGGSYVINGYDLIPCCLSSTAGSNDFRPITYEADTAEYTRTISKLDGSFSGPDLNVDYSFLN